LVEQIERFTKHVASLQLSPSDVYNILMTMYENIDWKAHIHNATIPSTVDYLVTVSSRTCNPNVSFPHQRENWYQIAQLVGSPIENVKQFSKIVRQIQEIVYVAWK